MINRFVGVGRLVKDPELKYTPSGLPFARFTIAVNRTFTNQQGEKEADFISCIAWRKQAENLANFMRKGNLIGVDGRLQTGSYEGQDGKRVYTCDVVADSIQFLEPRSDASSSPQNQRNYQNGTNTQGGYQNGSQGQRGVYNGNTFPSNDPFANSKAPVEVSEDDLPF